jgi:hypothetical protein
VLKLKINKIIKIKKKTSLTLLKTKALKAAFKVLFLATQKLINTKDVSPISSHPKKRVIRLAEETKKIILSTKLFKKRTSLSTRGSYLK